MFAKLELNRQSITNVLMHLLYVFQKERFITYIDNADCGFDSSVSDK